MSSWKKTELNQIVSEFDKIVRGKKEKKEKKKKILYKKITRCLEVVEVERHYRLKRGNSCGSFPENPFFPFFFYFLSSIPARKIYQ